MEKHYDIDYGREFEDSPFGPTYVLWIIREQKGITWIELLDKFGVPEIGTMGLMLQSSVEQLLGASLIRVDETASENMTDAKYAHCARYLFPASADQSWYARSCRR